MIGKEVDEQETQTNEEDLMLTTVDNPYDPKSDYDKWRSWDLERGYNTEEYIARLLYLNEPNLDIDDEFSVNVATNEAVRSILDNDDNNLYVLK